jgi:hypothetical protein
MALELLLPTLLLSAAWYISISTTTYRLAAMGGHAHPRRAFRPIANICMLFEMAGKSRANSFWSVALVVSVPIVGGIMFARLGGALMELTGRRRFTGYVLAMPPLALIGLPLIAYSARSMRLA